jgi:hypothetical protein
MPIRQVTKQEHGSTKDGFGNTCFFNSLSERAGQIPTTSALALAPYTTLLADGGWPACRRGTMVDTDTDSGFIERLACAKNVRLVLAYEEPGSPGSINTDKVRLFGARGPVIGIIKLDGVAHFNAFLTDFTFAVSRWPAPTLTVASATQQQSPVLTGAMLACRIAADARLARALQDREREALRREESDRRMAEELQRMFNSI